MRVSYLAGAAVTICGAIFVARPGSHQKAAPWAAGYESLPSIAVRKGDITTVTRIEIAVPEDEDTSLRHVAIERRDDGWELTSPIRARAALSKVQALLTNLEMLRVWKVVDSGVAFYEKYELTDAKALRVTIWRGTEKLTEFLCGKSSTDGQLVRIPGRDGIFALVNWGSWGYEGFLYTRDLRSWRETSLFTFEPTAVLRVEISNPHGVLCFERTNDTWNLTQVAGAKSHAAPRPSRPVDDFDPEKLVDLLRAYKSLSADDFGAEADEPGSGVAEAVATGGVVRIWLEGNRELTLRVGKRTTSRTRWAAENSRWAEVDGDRSLYVLSPWTADWAAAAPDRFIRATQIPPITVN